MTSEIREALRKFQPHEYHTSHDDHCYVLAEAARAYADLLDRGVEIGTDWETSATGKYPAIMVDRPGRYLVVRVGESP